MTNNSIEAIISNISKLDYDFALFFINSTFKGNQRAFLISFLNKEISVETLIKRWNQINLTGVITKDANLEELNMLDRLKLLSLTLSKLEITPVDFEVYYAQSKHTKEELVNGLSILLNDLYSVDRLRIRNKDVKNHLVAILEKVDDTKVDFVESLIPHPPEEFSESVKEDTVEINSVDSEVVSNDIEEEISVDDLSKVLI